MKTNLFGYNNKTKMHKINLYFNYNKISVEKINYFESKTGLKLSWKLNDPNTYLKKIKLKFKISNNFIY